MGISNLDPGAHERRPWNVGSLVGAKATDKYERFNIYRNNLWITLSF